MKNRTLAEIRQVIPYIPALRPYAGSLTACIVMQQLDYWFAIKDGQPFYKFMEEQRGERLHQAYKPGDSWCEELSMSPDEFRSAFDRIGVRYKSFSAYNRAVKEGDPFQGHFYLSYLDRIRGLTWYHRNHDRVDEFLTDLLSRKSGISSYGNRKSKVTDIDNNYLPELDKPISNKTETTPETTSEKTTTIGNVLIEDKKNVVAPSIIQEELQILLSMISSTEHSSRLISAVSAAIATHGVEYAKSNIAYCLANHDPHKGKNGIGGMVILALDDDYAAGMRAKDAEKLLTAERKKQVDEDERRRREEEEQEIKRWAESLEGQEQIARLREIGLALCCPVS